MELLLVSPHPGCSVGQLLSDWGHAVRHAPAVEQSGPLLQGVEGVLVVGTGSVLATEMARLRTAEMRPRPFLLALVAASAEQVPLEALLAAAVDDFLLMPFEPAQLQTRLEWLARRRRAGMQAPLEEPRSRGSMTGSRPSSRRRPTSRTPGSSWRR
ncbi:Hypothetical protein AA314_07281 [Archangium gephyra]|uniref:Uncharacterized protein n=1 Tax=Archangium gephyra TaxID=48 RepID=A0AAC8THA2_9BACT|nr:response regulator transcription factor [Archangium gephyra]AKJ05655.1 Hypothetical protein AA314_07281 [Archangium gephyra]